MVHRKSRGYAAARFHEHTIVEIIWTVIPFLILVAMAIPATKVLLKMSDVGSPDLTIKITGYQWKWQYEYLDHDIGFFSNLSTPRAQIENKEEKNPNYLLEVDNPLVLPVNKKIRFLITSNDVIHSWWVPDFAVKKDAVPGFIHAAWTRIDESGTYRGQCAELCGQEHGFMPIVVEAVSNDDFEKWLETQGAKKAERIAASEQVLTEDELITQGKALYEKHCVACHRPDGSGMPPVFPSLIGSPVVIGPLAAHIKLVLNGVPGTAMQPFGLQLSDVEIAAILTYQRHSWGNKERLEAKQLPTTVQPSQVKELRSN